jgi:hypothetical protein
MVEVGGELLGERNAADLSVKYKAELEEILTLKVCKQQEGISSVSVSADGQFAIYNVANRYIVRRLSPAATEFLNHGRCEAPWETSLVSCRLSLLRPLVTPQSSFSV